MDIKNNYLTDPSNNSDVYSKIGTREYLGKDLAPLLVDNLTNLVHQLTLLKASITNKTIYILKLMLILNVNVVVNSSGNETIRANTNNSAVARANIANNRREWKPIIFLLINKPGKTTKINKWQLILLLLMITQNI
jgi:hypothetical protein